MAERDEIIAGLERWAKGTYNTQAAVRFIAVTNEPLDRVWVCESKHMFTDETMYYFDWDRFDEHSGGISGGEYATWALVRSLHEGELNEQLWRLDPARSAVFGDAIARCREEWPH